MSYRQITIREIEVLGKIWMPASKCAQVITLTPYDVENIRKHDADGELTREGCSEWLTTHTGDFQSITDFHADIEDFDSPWKNEDNEYTFNDCMYPEED